MAKVRPIVVKGRTMKIILSQGNSKWPKDKALKEITNSLVMGPIKLKPNRAARKVGGLQIDRENMLVKTSDQNNRLVFTFPNPWSTGEDK